MDEAGFESVFEHSNDAILIFDAQRDEILAANPQSAVLLGYSRTELRDLGPSDIHPDELERFQEFVETVQTEGSGWTSSLSCLTKAGRRVPAEISATPFQYEGREAVLASIRDVSVRRERERALEELASTAESLMRLEDREDIASCAVEVAGRVLDLELSHLYLVDDSGSDPVLRPVAVSAQFRERFGTPPSFQQGEGLLWETFDEGEPRFFEDVRREAEMATDLPFGSAMLLPLGEHGVFGVASTNTSDFQSFHRDVAEFLTSLVNAALDRAHRLDELERTNERLDEFARIVSHDIRNPLMVAQARLELAREEHESEHHAHVEDALSRIDGLIDGLLTTAQDGEITPDLSVLDLATFVDDCWQHVSTSDATVVIETDASICADEQFLQQLLENLFRNGTEHGGETVTLTVGDLEDGFYVADDGPGVPESKREAIFEEGYSGSEAGTGLGLGIVARIVDAHGWSVDVIESGSGGARFEITGVERV